MVRDRPPRAGGRLSHEMISMRPSQLADKYFTFSSTLVLLGLGAELHLSLYVKQLKS